MRSVKNYANWQLHLEAIHRMIEVDCTAPNEAPYAEGSRA